VFGFNAVTSAATADVLNYNVAKTVVANATNVHVGAMVGTYDVSNGVATLAAGAPTVTQELADLTILVEQSAAKIAEVQIGNTTYVFASDSTNNTADGTSIIALEGVAGVTGFGYTAANDTVVVSDVTFKNAGHGGSATAVNSYTDAGFSLDGFTAAGAASAAAATGVTTYNGLAESAILDIANAGANAFIGAIDVNQALPTGVTSGDSLTVNFTTNAAELNGGLSLAGDSSLYINAAVNATIDSITDSGTTNTLSTISITNGAGLVTIDKITDTALTTIDASNDNGAVTLGAAATPISEKSLTINGSLGGFTLHSSGLGDVVTVGSDAYSTGGFAGVANVGDNNAVTSSGVDNTIAIYGGDDNKIFASGSGDTVTVAGNALAGNGVIAGTAGNVHDGATMGTSLAAGDTVNIGIMSGSHELAANGVGVWVGSGSTVNITSASVATIYTDGDVTGALSSGAYTQTTINASGWAGVSLNMNQQSLGIAGSYAGGTIADSFVNVAGATSLANALDMAASQALVLNQQFAGAGHTAVVNGVLEENANTGLADYFQYNGNTYVVESVNSGVTNAAHAALGTHDVVVELVGFHEAVGNLVFTV